MKRLCLALVCTYGQRRKCRHVCIGGFGGNDTIIVEECLSGSSAPP